MNKKKAILLALSLSLYNFTIIGMEDEKMTISPSSSPTSLMSFSPATSPGSSTTPSLSSSPTTDTSKLLNGAIHKSLNLLEQKVEFKPQKELSKKFIFSTTVKPSNPGLESWLVLNMVFPSKSKAVVEDIKGGALCSNGSTQDATGDMLAALIDVNKKLDTEYEKRILQIITAMLDNEIPTSKGVIEATQKLLLEKVEICNQALALIKNGIPSTNKSEKEEG